MRYILICLVAVLFAGAPALASDNSNDSVALEFTLGYSSLSLLGGDSQIRTSGNVGFDFHASGPISRHLRWGAGIGLAYAEEDLPGGGSDPDEDPSEEFSVVSPDVRLSWYQPIGRVFIEPGIALALIAADHAVRDPDEDDEYERPEDSRTRVGWGVRPSLAVGYRIAEHHAAGLQASYLWGSIDFDNEGDEINQWFVGAFYRFYF